MLDSFTQDGIKPNVIKYESEYLNGYQNLIVLYAYYTVYYTV